MDPERFDLPLRIVVEDPLARVAIALQRGATGKAELVGPARASPDALVFELAVTVSGAGADGRPRLLAPFVQGPPGGRFVYLNSGTAAGQPASTWRRRAKVPLTGLSWPLDRSGSRGRMAGGAHCRQGARWRPRLRQRRAVAAWLAFG